MAQLNAEQLAAHRREEAASGWPLLAACPSTWASGAMAYLDGLDADERRRLVDELNESDRAPDRAVGPALDAYLAALVGGSQRSRLGRVPVKIIAGVRKDDAVGGIDGWIRQVGLEGPAALPPPNLAADLDELVPVPPRRLRRLVTEMMARRFNAPPRRLSREDDAFELDVGLAGGPMEVLVSYAPSGGRSSHQLDYHVRPRSVGSLLAYEQLWRVPSRWDYLTDVNAERSVDHLGVLLSTLARFT